MAPEPAHTSAETVTSEALDVLARTVYGEARSESLRGQIAVAWVVRNRAARGGWWGSDVKSVCLKPKQFSCWNDEDPNREVCEAATVACARYLHALGVAALVLAGAFPDPTQGSTHYHTVDVSPSWARLLQSTVRIGAHVFYKEVA